MFTLTKDGTEIFLMYLFQTPLHDAAGNGKGDVVEILLRNGATINEQNARISFGEADRVSERKNERKRDYWYECLLMWKTHAFLFSYQFVNQSIHLLLE
jgi:hypothetical protein